MVWWMISRGRLAHLAHELQRLLKKSKGNPIRAHARGCTRIDFFLLAFRRNITRIRLVTAREFAFVNRRPPVQTPASGSTVREGPELARLLVRAPLRSFLLP
jgi:hypothetical protein